MNPDAFARIAESLRQYRRADLREFRKELGEDPVDSLYVDPLPGDAVLRSILSSNTTFLLLCCEVTYLIEIKKIS